jgi:class 3 adenylate cyclase/tetratricopeptide (TPR) repeat protein
MSCATPLGTSTPSREVRKTVTALFCDLVGSTTLGEQHDPEVLRPLLEGYFTEMRTAVERHGGQVQKFIGDAVSAVFGLPSAHEDDALRAVRAGVEMQERLVTLNATSPIPLEARVGITTGEVLVPADGTPIIGDAMNTASRLQSGAEPGQVLIGDPTWRLVRDAVVAEPVEALQAKGKAEPVPAHRVIKVASLSPMRTRRLDAPMVGREQESSLLTNAYRRAVTDRACQLFTVLGTAGAGKSRLVEEFLGTLQDAEVLQGRCLPYGDGITYYPVVEAMKQALHLADFDEEATVRQAISEAVKTEEHAEAITENLAKLLGASQGGAPEETFWAIRRLFEVRGCERPLVVVFDDIHWGEETFLDLIEHVADWSRDASILLLCMARPDLLDVRPSWAGGKTNASTISLAPLSEEESTELITFLLGSASLPEAVGTRIITAAEGNPLFVEEMLRMLVDDGLLRNEGDRWVPAGELDEVQVPATISALLSSRLDRLFDPERSVLERAAVIGKSFHRGAIAALLPEAGRAELDAHLRSLVRKDLISPERSALPGQDAYRFRHLLIRDAAYDQIPKTERAELHVGFADWLEQVAGERIVEQEEIVGYHLERAYRYREELGRPEDRGLRLRAATALSQAGRRAHDRRDARAAADLLGPAAGLSKGDPMELQVLYPLGEALWDVGGWIELRDVLGRTAEVARATGNRAYEMSAKVSLYQLDTHEDPSVWDLATDRALHEEALRTYRAENAEELVPWAILSLGEAEWSRGNMAGLSDFATEALETAIARHDRRLMRTSISYVMTAATLGSSSLSLALERADGLADLVVNDRRVLCTVLFERSYILSELGRADEATAALLASRAIERELGITRFEPIDGVVGHIEWVQGGPAAAEPAFQRALDFMLDRGDKLNAGWPSCWLARVRLDLGRTIEAEAALEAAGEVLRAEPGVACLVRSMRAVIGSRRGQSDVAFRLSGEAEELAATTDLAVVQADVALDKAEILQRAGRLHESRAAADDARARFEHKEHAIGIKRAREFLETA